MCVCFRERRPTFVWRWTVLAAPAMVVLALALVLVAEAAARVGHVAAEVLHVTLPAVPTPAPRSTLTKAMVCLRAREGIFTSLIKISYTHHGSSHVTCLHCLLVCSLFPHFLLQFSFFSFHFCTQPRLTLSSFSPSRHQFLQTISHPFLYFFFCLSSYALFRLERFNFFLSIYYCALTLLCVSL